MCRVRGWVQQTKITRDEFGAKPGPCSGTHAHTIIPPHSKQASPSPSKQRTEKQRLVLVHPRIGKQQGGIIHRHARTAGPKRVAVLLHKKLNKGLADLLHRPLFDALVVAVVFAAHDDDYVVVVVALCYALYFAWAPLVLSM